MVWAGVFGVLALGRNSHMGPSKSLDMFSIVAAILTDASQKIPDVVTERVLRLTKQKLMRRARSEGVGFLTKTLPRLGKAFDKALSGSSPLNAKDLRFKTQKDSQLPSFLGELFQRVLSVNGTLLPAPCVRSIEIIRMITGCCYKLELPYSPDLERDVVQSFIKTESDIAPFDNLFSEIADELDRDEHAYIRIKPVSQACVIRRARRLLKRLFASFDPLDIMPRHGPGAVSGKERPWCKYHWTDIPSRMSDLYPIDAYFYASLNAVVDSVQEIQSLGSGESSARVILVPKDSRGPRLISCEPKEFQWLQQGLSRALVGHVERHVLTRDNVRFTDQEPNRNAALAGSKNGRYATLDLKEASDRISIGLVRLLFPDPLREALLGLRSLSTQLPSGEVLKLRKFAPMGSALCFPVLAISVWALLHSSICDANARKGIYVYGDDVIVPTAHAASAMHTLSQYGLAINYDKCCTSGSFRESCGMDAFNGTPVTPVRLRTPWSSHRCPGVYSSWIAYANSYWDRHYYNAYERIVQALHAVYGTIPEDSMGLNTRLSLRCVSETLRPKILRNNCALQKVQFRIWDIKSTPRKRNLPGWMKLLRFFTETAASINSDTDPSSWNVSRCMSGLALSHPLSVGEYTERGTEQLVQRWR